MRLIYRDYTPAELLLSVHIQITSLTERGGKNYGAICGIIPPSRSLFLPPLPSPALKILFTANGERGLKKME